MVYIDKKKLDALFKWYMQEVGDSLISVLLVSHDGLVVEILTRDLENIDEKKFVGAFSSLVEVILKKRIGFSHKYNITFIGRKTSL